MRNRLSEPGTISILLLPVQFRRCDWILSAFFIGIVALYGAGVNDIILSNVRGKCIAAGIQVCSFVRHDFSKTKVLAQILASNFSELTKWPKLRTPVFYIYSLFSMFIIEAARFP